MKDKELMLEEIEATHTLGGAGEGRVQERGKWTGCTCYSAVRYTIAKCSRRNRHEATCFCIMLMLCVLVILYSSI
jgi:hypothetical protein